jgi:hypothetical protein
MQKDRVHRMIYQPIGSSNNHVLCCFTSKKHIKCHLCSGERQDKRGEIERTSERQRVTHLSGKCNNQFERE